MVFSLFVVLLVLLFVAHKMFNRPHSVFKQSLLDEFLPYSLVNEHHPDFYNLELPLKLDPKLEAVSVVYWAADGANNAQIACERVAYNEFQNSGVAKVDNHMAILRLAYPQAYYLSSDKNRVVLAPHVHYRILSQDGKLSKTYKLTLDSPEQIRQKFRTDKWSYLPPTGETCT